MFMEDMFKMQNPDDGVFWELEIDVLYDFKFYFTNRNPHCLKNFPLKDIKFNSLQKSKFGYNRTLEKRKGFINPKGFLV